MAAISMEGVAPIARIEKYKVRIPHSSTPIEEKNAARYFFLLKRICVSSFIWDTEVEKRLLRKLKTRPCFWKDRRIPHPEINIANKTGNASHAFPICFSENRVNNKTGMATAISDKSPVSANKALAWCTSILLYPALFMFLGKYANALTPPAGKNMLRKFLFKKRSMA